MTNSLNSRKIFQTTSVNHPPSFYPDSLAAEREPKKQDLRGIQAFRDSHPQLNIGPGLLISAVSKPFNLSGQDYAIPWTFGG